MFDYIGHKAFDDYSYVIGCDPGTITGLSIFDKFGLVESGVTITLPSTHPLEARTIALAYAIHDQIHEVCGDQQTLFAIEYNVIYNAARAGAALTQREFIAVLAMYAHKYGADVCRVSPTAAKLALTGTGKAKKADMIFAARDVDAGAIDGLSTIKKREAVADSIGIALAGMKQYVATKE